MTALGTHLRHNLVAYLALFIALSGTSYAISFPKNSIKAKAIAPNAVGGSEIKKNAVGPSEIKSNAVGAAELKGGVIGGDELADGSVMPADLGFKALALGDVNGDGHWDGDGKSLGAGFSTIAAKALTNPPGKSKLLVFGLANIVPTAADPLRTPGQATFRFLLDGVQIGPELGSSCASNACGSPAFMTPAEVQGPSPHMLELQAKGSDANVVGAGFDALFFKEVDS